MFCIHQAEYLLNTVILLYLQAIFFSSLLSLLFSSLWNFVLTPIHISVYQKALDINIEVYRPYASVHVCVCVCTHAHKDYIMAMLEEKFIFPHAKKLFNAFSFYSTYLNIDHFSFILRDVSGNKVYWSPFFKNLFLPVLSLPSAVFRKLQ